MSPAETAERTTTCANPTGGYFPVQLDLLRRLDRAVVDLFVQYERDKEPVLYYRAGSPLDANQAAKLRSGGIERIYVRSEDFETFGALLLQATDAQADDESVPPAERYAVLQLAMAAEIEHAARLVDCGPYVAVAEKLGRELSSMFVGNKVLPRDLFRLARHDFNTFTHVTNVASYAVILSERLGLCHVDELEQIATAAILHDIGKRMIPARILTKPSRLDPEERTVIETHPQRGYEDLCLRADLNFNQLMIVYQHHERYDGSGYPVGLKGEEIHPWARMLAIVDVFDAQTGTRPYRRPATAREAADYIASCAGTHFDPEMAACWTSIMAKT
jgi:HD-GYP domain-containing protein (c-di-GMP phosphodiesterase class II)